MPGDLPENPSISDREKLDAAYHRLRGAIHSLGLCVKVLETRTDVTEMNEYAQLIQQKAEEIEQLLTLLRHKPPR